MNILAISANFKDLVVGVQTDAGYFEQVSDKPAASHLVQIIDEVLKSAKLTPFDLDKIVVAAGPGSFTGIRIGFAAAQGLSFAASKPYFGISNFKILRFISGVSDALCTIPTGKGDYYVQEFKAKTCQKPYIAELDELANSTQKVVFLADEELEKTLVGKAFVKVATISGTDIIKTFLNASEKDLLKTPEYVRPHYAENKGN